MQFYEFFEKICGFIPDQYEGIQVTAETALPWLFFAVIYIVCTISAGRQIVYSI